MYPSVRCQKGKGESLFHVASKWDFFFFLSFLGRTKCNEVSKSLVSGVAFPKQVSRSPYSPKLLRGSIWPSGSPGCRRYAHRLEKQGRDIKEKLVCKRKGSGEVKRKRDGFNTAWQLLSRPVPGGSTRRIYSKLTPPHLHVFLGTSATHLDGRD